MKAFVALGLLLLLLVPLLWMCSGQEPGIKVDLDWWCFPGAVS
jgi:hypothetical protein